MYFILLTLILLTWTIWRASTNASKWGMGFNSAFKGLTRRSLVGTINVFFLECTVNILVFEISDYQVQNMFFACNIFLF